jgi:alpha-1,6-mannosyltransferase
MATIAHLANFFGPRSGGIRTCARELANSYATLGHSTHVIVPGKRDQETNNGSIVFHEVASPVVPRSGGYRVILRRKHVEKMLERIQPDAIELSDRTTLLPISGWAKGQGIPLTIIAHERLDGVINSFLPSMAGVGIADRLNRLAAKHGASLVCTTNYAGQEFDRIGIEYTKIPLGVDLETFSPDKASTQWREQFDAEVLVTLCSRLSLEKHPDFAIEVLESLIKSGVNAHLLVVGSGPLERSIASKLKYLPATMLGFLEGKELVAQALASSDVVIAPGPIETFGLAALEALACGTPVISNYGSAIPEVVGDAGLALPLSGELWARGIQKLIAAPERRFKARNRAEHFTWVNTAERLLEIHGLTSTRAQDHAA